MIDRTTIDRIFDAARIVEVVGDFVTLKKRGVNHVGCCPFHNERTPSFNVNPARNIYKCFGCGKAGNSVNFIMEHEHLTYPDALRYLAKKYNITIEEKEQTEEDKQRGERRESLMVLSAYAARIFHENLFNTGEGAAIGLSYFKQRGFREDTIKRFELGYCLEQRDAFTQKALKDGYKEEFLTETGLSIKSERGCFDRFSARVMFPVHSISGKVIAFGGRILKDEKKTAKYVNSPESEIYHKSKILYGIFHAKNSIVKKDKCFLVEGYTDVISLHQAGIENVVASSGTSLTVEQIQLIKRFTPNITVLYDGDAAGIKASLRGIDLILQEDMNVKVLLLPDSEDPDSFARTHSATELEEYINANETDFISFKARLLLEDAQNDLTKRSSVITDVVQSISLIPQAITRSVFLKETARLFEMDEQMLTETANVFRQKRLKDNSQAEVRKQDAGQTAWQTALPTEQSPSAVSAEAAQILREEKELSAAEMEIIRVLLRYGQEVLVDVDEETGETGITAAGYIINELCSDDLELQKPLFRAIFDEYRQLIETGDIIDEKHFLEHRDPEVSRLTAGFEPKYALSKIHFKNGALVKTDENNLIKIASDAVLEYKKRRLMMRLKELAVEMQEANNNNDLKLLELLCFQNEELTRIKKTLGENLGKRVYQ